jgi:hypothetical protein
MDYNTNPTTNRIPNNIAFILNSNYILLTYQNVNFAEIFDIKSFNLYRVFQKLNK